MGIELKITADSVADLNDQMARLLTGAPVIVDLKSNAAGETVVGDPQPVVEAPKSRSRKKAEPVPTAAGPTPADEQSSDGAEASPPANEYEGCYVESQEATGVSADGEPQVTYADVQKAVTQLAAAKGREAVVEVFKKFGVDHGTKLKPEQWVDAVAELELAKGA